MSDFEWSFLQSVRYWIKLLFKKSDFGKKNLCGRNQRNHGLIHFTPSKRQTLQFVFILICTILMRIFLTKIRFWKNIVTAFQNWYKFLFVSDSELLFLQRVGSCNKILQRVRFTKENFCFLKEKSYRNPTDKFFASVSTSLYLTIRDRLQPTISSSKR